MVIGQKIVCSLNSVNIIPPLRQQEIKYNKNTGSNVRMKCALIVLTLQTTTTVCPVHAQHLAYNEYINSAFNLTNTVKQSAHMTCTTLVRGRSLTDNMSQSWVPQPPYYNITFILLISKNSTHGRHVNMTNF